MDQPLSYVPYDRKRREGSGGLKQPPQKLKISKLETIREKKMVERNKNIKKIINSQKKKLNHCRRIKVKIKKNKIKDEESTI